MAEFDGNFRPPIADVIPDIRKISPAGVVNLPKRIMDHWLAEFPEMTEVRIYASNGGVYIIPQPVA